MIPIMHLQLISPSPCASPGKHLLVLPILLLILTIFPTTTLSQQIGSFFTAIYLNGAVIGSSQTSCSNMGQAQYCCGAGQSCDWDDAGRVACCSPAGANCQGTAAYGAGANQGQYATSSSSSAWAGAQQQTTTVYGGGGGGASTTGCNCVTTTTAAGVGGGGGAVVPIVPVTKATLETSYYSVPTSTYYPSAVTTTQQAVVTTAVPGGSGAQLSTKGLVGCAAITTVTEANVGSPVRTVGCYVIVNEGSHTRHAGAVSVSVLLWLCFGVSGAFLL